MKQHDASLTEVCLVQMPYAPLERPSIGLGLLKAALSVAQIRCHVVYANVLFAEAVGFHSYRWIEGTASEYLLGEWTFSKTAFPNFEPDDNKYLELILQQWPALVPRPQIKNAKEIEDQKNFAFSIRRKTLKFVDQLAKSILSTGTRIVGCSSTFQQNCASLALLRRIRELSPDIITLIGGANCEGEMGLEMQQAFPWIDFVIPGEADKIIVDLCQKLLENGRWSYPTWLLNGVIAHSSQVDASIKSENHSFRVSAEDFESLPTPDYIDYFMTLENSAIRHRLKPGLLVEASRGCWWGQRYQCTFCGFNGLNMKYREKSTERVVQELSDISKRYGLKNFGFVDNVLSPSHMKTLLPQMAKEEEPYSSFCEVRTNLKREDLQELARAGFRSIQFGVENLNDSALKLMRKGTTSLKNIELLKWARKLGICAYWNFLCGIPGECDKWYVEIADWIPAIIHLQPPMTIVNVRFDRFSSYHQSPETFGLSLVPYRTYRFVFPLSGGSLERFAYFFEDVKDNNRFNIWDLRLPGQQALKEKIDIWKSSYHGECPPILCLIEKGDNIEITDTRPCAFDPQLTLKGLAARILKLCDEVRSVDSLHRSITAQEGLNPSWGEINAIVDELKERKILLQMNGKLLGLAVPYPMAQMPTFFEFPFGFAELPDFEKAKRESLREIDLGCLFQRRSVICYNQNYTKEVG